MVGKVVVLVLPPPALLLVAVVVRIREVEVHVGGGR